MGRLGDTLQRLRLRPSADPPPAPDWDDASAWARASGDRKAAREAERRAAGEAWPTDAGAYVLGEVLGCGATAKVSERD
jgi:hypothetical protein